MPAVDVGLCKSCGATVLWSKTVNDKIMPLDEKEVSGFVLRDGIAVAQRIHLSHFATCPSAAEHRKKKED